MDPERKPERKVTAATAGAFLATSAVLAVLQAVQDGPGLIAGLPDLLEGLLIALVPALVTVLAGYRAEHTYRPADRPPVPPARRPQGSLLDPPEGGPGLDGRIF